MEEQKEQKVREGRKITITMPDKTYMDLLIKLRHENITWKRFFNFLIEGYVKDDLGITEYLDRKMTDIRSKKRTKMLQKERKASEETVRVFGLDEREIDDIYDMLEDKFEP